MKHSGPFSALSLIPSLPKQLFFNFFLIFVYNVHISLLPDNLFNRTARRSNQSILKEISPGISLKGMMLKLKLQYFGHLMPRVDSLEKTLGMRWPKYWSWGQEEKGTTEDEMAGWHH